MFEGLEPPVKEVLCSFGKAMKDLSKEDLKLLAAALNDPRWTHKDLTLAVSSRGFKTNEKALRVHRKGECICSKI
jgi:hypothetical protein